jgi:ATP-binding cassette subfamily F protein 3
MDSTATDGELRGYLAMFLFSGDDVFKRVGQLSGGEKSRLMLSKIIYARPQLLAMDEPTNHLDIASREALETALVEYPGTILFVTHDRYLVQKIATHLLYIEDGQAYVFDRLSAFEEWLAAGRGGGAPADPHPAHPHPALRATLSRGARGERDGGLSKNRREQIQREVTEIEARIAAVEGELAELERAFQNPQPDFDWEGTHRRYAELKDSLETLYADLANRWELMG